MDKELYENIYQVEETHWWYKARREIIFDWIEQVLRAKKYERANILDIGCGTGFNVSYLKRLGHNLNVHGLDFSKDALTYCQSRQLANLIMGSAESLPLSQSAYDMVLALDIVEHVERDRLAISEAFRTLKPSGTFVVFVPAYQFLWSFQDEISHHKRRYLAGALKTKLREAGFQVEKISYANAILFLVVWFGRILLKTFPQAFKITSESEMSPAWLNKFLYYIFRLEKYLLRLINLPFGVSILCVCRKPE